MPDQSISAKASDAVVNVLKADGFIRSHRQEVYARLEQAFTRATSSEGEGSVMFVAETLPLMAAIVHLGTTLDDYIRATHWAEERFPGGVPTSTLSALTFIYVVEQGEKDAREARDPQRRGLWKKMRESLDDLLRRG